MPIRPSICSGRSTCSRRIFSGARRSSTQAVGSSQQLVVETIVDEKNPQKLMQALASLAFSPRAAAARRRVSPAQARGACRRRSSKSGISAAGVRPDGDLGRGLHPSRQSVPRHGPEGRRRRRRRCLRDTFTGQGKPIGELETNLEQLSFFDRLPGRRAAAAARGRARSDQRNARASSTRMLERLGATATSTRSPGASTATLQLRPSFGRR